MCFGARAISVKRPTNQRQILMIKPLTHLCKAALRATTIFNEGSENDKVNRCDWSRRDWNRKTKGGCVYAFFSKRNTCLYVGQTGRTIKDRVNTATSLHRKKPWWKKWKTLRHVKCSNPSGRILWEMLLIVGHLPHGNKKPSADGIKRFFGSPLLPVANPKRKNIRDKTRIKFAAGRRDPLARRICR